MFDARETPCALQRTRGRAEVALGPGSPARLVHLHQSGSAKAMLPRMHGRAPEIVFLNTAGGITGGDRLGYALDLAGGAEAVATTQTAERAYRAAGDVGRVDLRLSLGKGARLHWLPQETILFDGAALERATEVEMAADATCLLLETLVLGRAAMGETLRALHLRDRRSVRRGGRLVMLEPVRIDAADLGRPGAAGLGGARALATLSLFAPDAEDRIGRLRDALPGPGSGIRAAASAWDGRVTARFLATEAFGLRRAVARAIEALTGRPLPRVWQI